MSYDFRQFHEFLKPASTSEFSSEIERIGSKQRGCSKMRAPVPPANRTSKFPEKLKTEDHVNPSRMGFHHEAKKISDDKTGFQLSGYGNRKHSDECAVRRDELVKYMSNLPDYLLRTEKGENFGEKALSVGVLDWEKLESWKHKQNSPLARGRHNEKCSSSDLSVKMPSKSSTGAVKKKPHQNLISLTSKGKASHRHDHCHCAKNIHQNVKSPRDLEEEILATTEGLRWTPSTFNCLDKNHTDISLRKGKRADVDLKITSRAGSSSSNGDYRTAVASKEHKNDRYGGNDSTVTCLKGKGKNSDFLGDVGFSPSTPDSIAASPCSSESMSNGNSGGVKIVESAKDTNIDAYREERPTKVGNIVLLVPKMNLQTRFQQNSHHAETRTAANENARKPRRNSFSDGCATKEAQFANFGPEIPKPIALPPRGKRDSLPSVVPHGQDTGHDTDFSSVISRSSSCSDKASSLLSETTYEDCEESNIKLVNQHAESSLKEPVDNKTAETKSERSRHPSPNRRFSFSLSRIGRSFSFKEGSSLPRFSLGHLSVKSGPVTVESSTGSDNSNKGKLIAHNRTRSSPFRRLLDPIRKNKAADSLHSAGTPQSLKKGSIDAMSSTTTIVGESLHLKKSDGSALRAVLHHTVKNGLPLYKFVVNNESSILVTTGKNFSSCEKDSTACNFTFYAVEEIKKKSGAWIGLGGKERSCGYVYNVVGQMKDSGSHFTDINGPNSLKHCTKEYVLSGVEAKQADQGSPKVNHTNELAAAVIRIPCENLIHGELPHDDINLMVKGCTQSLVKEHGPCCSGDKENFGSTTVILPGGVHGSPNNGAPSPLIFRWKSGGSCDCGGWDIGCKLHVLHSQEPCFNGAEDPKSCASSERLELYLEGRGEQSRPVFSLAPLMSGMDCVEFRSPISVLQAFFICVAVKSCQKSSGFSELNTLYDLFSKENDGFHFQGNAPARYAPNPPLSPVGRV